MPWKHCVIGIDEPCERICDGVNLLRLSAGDPDDVALFTRTTADRVHRVLLLSPRAVELAGAALSSCWLDCDAPELFTWDLVIGPEGASEKLGVPRPQFRRPPPLSPITVIGRDPSAGAD